MADLAEDVDGLPTICGSEERIRQAMQASRTAPVFLPQGASGFGEITSAFAIALHMHQPLIPAGGPELRTAQMISNLQSMLNNPDTSDNHNARVFLWCYKRMGEFVPQLLDEGFQPRVMLEYSGTLLYGLRQMGATDVLDALARLTGDERDRRAVEWLGCPCGAMPWLPPPRCRTTAFTSRPGSTTLPPSLAWTRLGGCAASRPPKWRFPISPTWPTSSSRPSSIAATSGSSCKSIPSSSRMDRLRSTAISRTASSAPT